MSSRDNFNGRESPMFARGLVDAVIARGFIALENEEPRDVRDGRLTREIEAIHAEFLSLIVHDEPHIEPPAPASTDTTACEPENGEVLNDASDGFGKMFETLEVWSDSDEESLKTDVGRFHADLLRVIAGPDGRPVAMAVTAVRDRRLAVLARLAGAAMILGGFVFAKTRPAPILLAEDISTRGVQGTAPAPVSSRNSDRDARIWALFELGAKRGVSLTKVPVTFSSAPAAEARSTEATATEKLPVRSSRSMANASRPLGSFNTLRAIQALDSAASPRAASGYAPRPATDVLSDAARSSEGGGGCTTSDRPIPQWVTSGSSVRHVADAPSTRMATWGRLLSTLRRVPGRVMAALRASPSYSQARLQNNPEVGEVLFDSSLSPRHDPQTYCSPHPPTTQIGRRPSVGIPVGPLMPPPKQD